MKISKFTPIFIICLGVLFFNLFLTNKNVEGLCSDLSYWQCQPQNTKVASKICEWDATNRLCKPRDSTKEYTRKYPTWDSQLAAMQNICSINNGRQYKCKNNTYDEFELGNFPCVVGDNGSNCIVPYRKADSLKKRYIKK